MKPVVSLVIPFYNEEANVETVARGLLRVLADSKVPHELLLVDNGSRDATQKCIREIVSENASARMPVTILSVNERVASARSRIDCSML